VSGSAVSRLERVDALLAERELDALLVTGAANLRYLTGYSGSNGLALVGASGERLFLTDFRYATQIEVEVSDAFDRKVGKADLIADLGAWLEGLGPRRPLRLGFEDDHVTVRRCRALREHVPEGVELVAAGGIVEELRIVKDADELRRIRDAAALIDDVLATVAQRGLVGRSERDVVIDLENEMRRLGASAPSFPTIVAAGSQGALPHATPRDVAIGAGTLVVVDLGAQLDGYCSDCTRTFATGELDAEQRDVYDLVLRAQEAGLAAVAPGPTGREVDAVAREVIAAAGYGDQFGHGLGHGVGIEVHEEPRLSQVAGNRQLAAGNVVTVEPGVYLPGRFGVRIEDLVAVTDDGHEILSRFTKELLTVG
jgi:Xaa-Pro aminopeptidase